MKPVSFSSCWHFFIGVEWRYYNLRGWALDEHFILSPSLQNVILHSIRCIQPLHVICLCIILFFYIFLFLLLAIIGLSWDAVSHIPCAIIALRQILISTGDIALSNTLLFITMGVWQQIILVSLFLSFKVMMEFTNPHLGVSEHALLFQHSRSTQLKCKVEGKGNLLRVWHSTAVTSICRCCKGSFIFITHQKLLIYKQTWELSAAWHFRE